MSLTRLPRNYRYWLLILALVAFLYVVVPQFNSFRSSWQVLQHPDYTWIALALVAIASTYISAAVTYCLLALRPLSYSKTVLVQLAVMFINRLLPGGIGGLGANYAYLRHNRHSAIQATGVVAANNTLGLIGHSLLVVVSLLAFPYYEKGLHWTSLAGLAKFITFLSLLLLFGLLAWGRRRLLKVLAGLLIQLRTYQKRPHKLLGALGSSMLLTLGNVLALSACCLALGVHLPFVSVLIIFSFGVGTGTAVPTPGGLGGFEAGLTAGLIASQVNSSTALSIALLYRLLSYWLPLLPGGLALVVCQRREDFGR